MIDTLKPGQNVRCTLVKLPQAASAGKTILRLMRRDPAVVKGLRKSHKVRQRTTVVYNRGNRDWVQRQKCAKIVELRVGNDWTMMYDPTIGPDMKSVSDYITVSAA